MGPNASAQYSAATPRQTRPWTGYRSEAMAKCILREAWALQSGEGLAPYSAISMSTYLSGEPDALCGQEDYVVQVLRSMVFIGFPGSSTPHNIFPLRACCRPAFPKAGPVCLKNCSTTLG